MRNFKTMTKVLLLVAMMLTLLVAVSFMGYRTAGRITTEAKEMFDDAAMPAMWILNIKGMAIQNRRLIGTALGNDDRGLDLIARLTAANSAEGTKLYQQYEKTISDNASEERASYAEVLKYRTEANGKQREIMEAARSKDPARIEAIRERVSENGDITASEAAYVAALDKHANFMVEMAKTIERDMEASAHQARLMILVVSLSAMAIGVVFAVVISRLITRPLAKTQASITVFAQGDLTATFDTHGKDEVARISQNLQEMSNVLGGVIGSVNDASRNISDTAEEFSSMAQETSAAVEEFRANVDEMSANLDSLASASEEVNASVQEVAAGAQTTAEKGTEIARKVDDAITAGDSGIDAVRSVVTGIGRVADSSTAATGAIVQLGERARQIQSFVAQIGSIADQTNLLALNAAIEAARAGEAGRGFAVVAEEVRKLAEDSNVAAKNIAELAEKITNEIDTIVGYAQENASDSNDAKDLSARTEEVIAHMIEYLRDIAASTQDLAAVAEEQAASSEEIAEAVQNMSTRINDSASAGESIRTGVGEVATASERLAQGAEGLSSLAGDLQEDLSFFTLDDSRGKPGKKDRLRALPAR